MRVDDATVPWPNLRLNFRPAIALFFCFEAVTSPLLAEPGLEPGVEARFESLRQGDKPGTEWVTLPNLALFVRRGSSPSPLLPPGPFVADATGFISVELRATRWFQAEFSGRLALEINGTVVVEGEGNYLRLESPQPIRLAKGTNSIRLRFTSPPEGDAYFRVNWSAREFMSEPLSSGTLSHTSTAGLREEALIRRGREIFLDALCARCHLPEIEGAPNPELRRHAPRLDGIGARRREGWLAAWILNPNAQHPGTRMPAMFSGPTAVRKAGAIAAYLSKLEKPGSLEIKTEELHGSIAGGRALYEKLHCAACHDSKRPGATTAVSVSALKLRTKYTPQGLKRYLLNPERENLWTRMPKFGLGDREAADLAAYLLSVNEVSQANVGDSAASNVEEGRELFRTTGCLDCHPVPEGMEFSIGPKNHALSDWTRGCLAEGEEPVGNSPRYTLSPDELKALRALGRVGLDSLNHVAHWEVAKRQSTSLGCQNCHGTIDGLPPIAGVGAKLKSAWMHQLFEGVLPYKPRPWLEARMPAFPGWAGEISAGLAAMDGYPVDWTEGRSGAAAGADVGRKLVSAAGGFACTACHAVGSYDIVQSLDGRGVNLAYTGSRLLRPYFERWLRNPLRIDPATKMPAYFEGDQSPLTEYYGGDANRQIGAIWEYLQMGDRLPPPVGASGP